MSLNQKSSLFNKTSEVDNIQEGFNNFAQKYGIKTETPKSAPKSEIDSLFAEFESFAQELVEQQKVLTPEVMDSQYKQEVNAAVNALNKISEVLDA